MCTHGLQAGSSSSFRGAISMAPANPEQVKAIGRAMRKHVEAIDPSAYMHTDMDKVVPHYKIFLLKLVEIAGGCYVKPGFTHRLP